MSDTKELPPLPERYSSIGFFDVYTAQQMLDYAQAALDALWHVSGPNAEVTGLGRNRSNDD